MPLGSGSFGERPAMLFLLSTDGGGNVGKLATLLIAGDRGVDLGAVGRALGLDPSTVRLNGHFLSRSPDLVSSVTWRSLLSFFASRGFPSGSSDRDAVLVQGKPAATQGLQFSDLEDGNYLSFKRKVRLENERPLKKKRVTEGNSCMLEVGDGQLSDDDSLCIKRRLKLEDNNSFKKRKTAECNSDSINEQCKLETVVPKTGFSYGCINEHGKLLREEETVPTIPCKRVMYVLVVLKVIHVYNLASEVDLFVVC
ncbi:hypothetical protein COCNU_11G002660 [Cocos nucifera]|uniref:Uncharacterized protein n=1 Tax=Cocos nucifera TaxID=13894 RepID=A0A8K0N8Y1_COCNU|nr:hypothetical protein COCNU_11G002660 [Cocos nucifera]